MIKDGDCKYQDYQNLLRFDFFIHEEQLSFQFYNRIMKSLFCTIIMILNYRLTNKDNSRSKLRSSLQVVFVPIVMNRSK